MEQDQSVAAGVDSGSAEPDAVGFDLTTTNPEVSAYGPSAGTGASAVVPDGGAQAVDGSACPAEHATLSGMAGEMANYQSTENGATVTNEMGELAPDLPYEEGNVSLQAPIILYVGLPLP
jgi:pre-mRNA-processing factor 39